MYLKIYVLSNKNKYSGIMGWMSYPISPNLTMSGFCDKIIFSLLRPYFSFKIKAIKIGAFIQIRVGKIVD